MNLLKGFLILLLLVGAIAFAVKNNAPLSLKYYFGWESVSLPLFLWSFFSFLLGFILSGVAASFSKLGLHARLRRLKKTLLELERKRNALRRGLSPP